MLTLIVVFAFPPRQLQDVCSLVGMVSVEVPCNQLRLGMGITFLSPISPHYSLVAVIVPISHAAVFQLQFLLPGESYFLYPYKI
jgi:hypothetical protein